MPQHLSGAQVPMLLRPGMTVYAPGVGGESVLLSRTLAAAPECAAGVRFIGVWLPGINRTDYAQVSPTARATAFFLGPAVRRSFAAGRVDLKPLTYLDIDAYLRRARIDMVLLQLSPPDDAGRCSLGIANDFADAVVGAAVDRAATLVAHINPRMPRTVGATTVAYQRLDHVVEGDEPLLGERPGEDPVFACIGAHLARVVENGATLEVGIGRVQQVLRSLAGHARLSLHTGAITPSVLELVAGGALADRAGAITTGVAFGDEALYRFVDGNAAVRFAPVAETHAIATLARIESFVAVNSVVEVDLLGQANAEMRDGRQISGSGGITEFMRGARLSPGGRAVVALPATSDGGKRSRIVPLLDAGTTVSVPRGDMDVVITEHGMAELRHRDIDARAAALIAVAAPRFRHGLAAAWHDYRRRL
jgi:acyl-CoA hydrolase